MTDPQAPGKWLRGGLIFFPYLCVYLLAWAMDLHISVLRAIFCALNVVALIYLVRCLIQGAVSIGRWHLLFWTGLFAFFLLPGALIEFPLDPWEHLRRIYRWDTLDLIREHS